MRPGFVVVTLHSPKMTSLTWILRFSGGLSVAMATRWKNWQKARRYSLGNSVAYKHPKFHRNRTTLNGRSASTNKQTNKQARWRRGAPRRWVSEPGLPLRCRSKFQAHESWSTPRRNTRAAGDCCEKRNVLAFVKLTISNFEGCQRDNLKRYQKMLKTVSYRNFLPYRMVPVSVLHIEQPRSSSGLEISVSLKIVKKA